MDSRFRFQNGMKNEYVTTKGKVIYLAVNPELRCFLSPGSRGCLCFDEVSEELCFD